MYNFNAYLSIADYELLTGEELTMYDLMDEENENDI